MVMGALNGISSMNINANYGKSVPPVRPSKKVDFEDAMVVPVGESKETEESQQVQGVRKTISPQAAKMQKAYNEIASTMQGQNNYYNAAMQGGTYEVVGSMFDATA